MSNRSRCIIRGLAALIAVLIAAPAARATIIPEAAKVLDRYVAAIGGRGAVEAERTLHGKSTLLAFGFVGTLESWSQRPDKIASQTALGPFTLKDGFDGTTAWRVDQNGKLSIRDGKDLEDEKGSAWVVRRGDRIAQLVVQKLPRVVLEETGDLSPSRRGAGGFGHTGER